MISGTPLFEGIEDLKGELCFLRLEPFAGNLDDGFFDFVVKNHWENRSCLGIDTLRVLSLLMLRRSKSMKVRATNHPLLGLKPLNLTFEPVPQDPSERALYCFMEYLVHATMRSEDGSRDETKHRMFLRLLRELCVSPALLNGGLDCSSQLATLNALMVDQNRRDYNLSADQEETTSTSKEDMSCDGAIRFLSQVQDKARVEADFVTTQTVGGGGGISRRNRATESIEDQMCRTKEALAKVSRDLQAAKSRRARLRWHVALAPFRKNKRQPAVA